MSINNSQGQTLRMVGVYLPKPVFTHGQLYVALSRIGSWHGVRVLVEGGWVAEGQMPGCQQGCKLPMLFTVNFWTERAVSGLMHPL
jgi:hypothetical protein